MGGLPGLLHVSCGKSEAVVDATEPFADDTLAAYTHPPLDLSDEFDSDTLGTQWYPVGINTPPPSIWSVSWKSGLISNESKPVIRESRGDYLA